MGILSLNRKNLLKEELLKSKLVKDIAYRKSEPHDYSGKTPTKVRSIKSPKNGVKSRLYEGTALYKKRLEENKKGMASPKRYAPGVGASAKTSPRRMKAQPVMVKGKPPLTTNKLRKANFKSPTAQRKAPLIKENKASDKLRNNVSATRAGTRRSRMERKATIEKQKEPNEEEMGFRGTITSDIQEIDCPMPTPAPERFMRKPSESDFMDDNSPHDINIKPDFEEDESNFDLAEEPSAVIGKLPVERQSITNSKVFSMSETQFQKFDQENETEEFKSKYGYVNKSSANKPRFLKRSVC